MVRDTRLRADAKIQTREIVTAAQDTADAINIFSQYMRTDGIFNDKLYLSSAFVPARIEHRNEEIRQISSALAPVLRGFHPSNVFIYGTCGTGKTICTKFVVSQLNEMAKKNGHKLKVIYINCKMKKVADTEYRLFAQLLKEMGEYVPDTGLPTDVLYRKFFEKVESTAGTTIIVLDEIDTLVKKVGDDFLYNLSRADMELKKSHLTVIGITNDVGFKDYLDLRVKSSLSEEEIIFKPYNAMQLKDILLERSKHGFKENCVPESVLNKCAAIAAQEHGDARRALDLLRVAGEIAERTGDQYVDETHVDTAEQKIDLDRITETVKAQPRQSQTVLYAVIKLRERAANQKKWVDSRLLTGDVYSMYTGICNSVGMKALTQRRVSDLISELDMLGIIAAKVISNGRYGRTREIVLTMNESVLSKIHAFLSDKFAC